MVDPSTGRASNIGQSQPDPEEQQIFVNILRFFLTGELAHQLTDCKNGAGPEDGRAAKKELVVNAMDLFDKVPGSATLLFRGWQCIIGALKEAASQAAASLGLGEDFSGTLRVRLVHVPGRSFERPSVSTLRVRDRGHFVRIAGTVTRAGPVKVVQEWRAFRCETCGHTFSCRASPTCGYEFEVPRECPGGQKQTRWDPKAKRPKTSRCHSKQFATVPANEQCMADFQEIRVQDDMQAMGVGVVPQSCAVTVFGDLVGVAQPGDSVVVEGVVCQRWRPTFQGKRVEVEIFIEATHVVRRSREGNDEQLKPETEDTFRRFWSDWSDEWQGRQALVAATAPWLSGLPVPKLALLLTLVGGNAALKGANSTVAENTSRWGRFMGANDAKEGGEANATKPALQGRMTPHLLLLGDPGTGKSQLLQAAQELGTRSIRTSGLGCTSAGLTCAAVRDGPDWALEAGALVLADGGVCCIDEFSTIRSHDKAAVHEAMEQQTVSVAKAGLVCRLRSRCSVVAAQNCRGSKTTKGQGATYDLQSSVAVNSGLPPPLLSRFDLVVVFAEGGKGVSDMDKADFIIESCEPSSKKVLPEGESQQWNHSRLRHFVAWAKERHLEEDDEAGSATLLQTYFQKLRNTSLSTGGSGGVTARTLESLVRLAQAHAKLMNHRCVQIEDAVAVVVLHRASLQDHVVGADSLPEDFAPSIREMHEEQAACGVHVSLEGLELNHGTDITSKAVYAKMEQAILRSLRLCRSKNDRRQLVAQEHQASPLAIADVPRAQVTQRPGATCTSAVSAAPSQTQVPQTESKPRGRTLGCRIR
ncbi:unnamed protein product [Durusdinium trenchii]|uniref:DNA helicase n=1 Tax=Durusdinium trenchii TaxID=1381693 RepID=A0ABP0QV63_9DINO